MKRISLNKFRSEWRLLATASVILAVVAVMIATGRGSLSTPVSAQSVDDVSKTPARDPITVTASDDKEISQTAMNQIAALEREKESRTAAQRKIDSQLLYKIKMERKQAIADGVPTLESDLVVNEKGQIEVDITANVSDSLLKNLKESGAELIAVVPQYRSITAKMPITAVESFAGRDDVIFVQPRMDSMTNTDHSHTQKGTAQPAVFSASPVAGLTFDQRASRVRSFLRSALNQPNALQSGTVQSEGDTSHRAAAARAVGNVNGTGLKIGVLSNGVDTLAAVQALGDLPATVTVLPGQAGTGDEGNAMLQIVYDVAPGAQLFFATANTSITSFAQNIKDLRTAGCDIIIDDVSYFVESPFQTGQAATVVSTTNGGIVTQAINDVTVGSQAGAMYFSSAGNSGNVDDGTAGAWEGDFVDGGPVAAPVTGTGNLHNFGGGATFDTLTVAGRVLLKWSDPLGGSANDYDLFALNSTGTTLVIASTNIQSGTQDPSEDMGNRSAGQRMVIVRKTGSAARFLHLNTNRGVLAVPTSGVTFGHNASPNAVTMAATPSGPVSFDGLVFGPFPNAFTTANVSERFTSDGPRKVFYNPDSTAITPGDVSSTGGQVLAKPDLTAADGVSTTLTAASGLNPFFGTSAAAPHAGALAALIKSASPASTSAQIIAAMKSSALDIEAPGADRDTGSGIIMPIRAMAALGVTGNAFIETGVPTIAEAFGNGNGRAEPGETINLTIPLNNIGLANATAVSATITTATAGVTIVQGTQPYANLNAISGTASNAAPFQIKLAKTFPCNSPISFTVTVNFTGAGNPQVLNLVVPTGAPVVSTGILDATVPPPSAGVATTTGTQTGRIVRNGIGSSCATAPKAAPGLNDSTVGRRFDTYTYTASAAGCVTVTLTNTGTALFVAAYNATGYDPTNPNLNYLADPGTSSAVSTFSFNVTAGQKFTLVVHEITVGGGAGINYSLNVNGPIAGPCIAAPIGSRGDYDGDGKTDLGIYRPSNSTLYASNLTGGVQITTVGTAGDVAVPGDYDNDGKADAAVYRASTGQWFVVRSSDSTLTTTTWGNTGDVPEAADYDGDGKTDVAVYRPSTGVWFTLRSSDGGVSITAWGSTGDVPVRADYDGDGKVDVAVYRPSTGVWYALRSTDGGVSITAWGNPGDSPVPADYDGDSKEDVAVFRPTDGTWYILNSATGTVTFTSWGSAGDVPVPGDYDGDGRDDIAVYRTGLWLVNRSTAGSIFATWGTAGDVAIPTRYIP